MCAASFRILRLLRKEVWLTELAIDSPRLDAVSDPTVVCLAAIHSLHGCGSYDAVGFSDTTGSTWRSLHREMRISSP